MNFTRPKTDAINSESTTSSVASGSSDVVNTMDKNSKITNEINKEMDKLFGTALERASSGYDLKVVAPLRHKKRQCRSQEVLPLEEISVAVKTNDLANILPSEMQINDVPNPEKPKAPHVIILHDNQRAEIVASVTERLYSKLKKKEEAAVSKVESMVDRKIMEPLSELKICTNARQRLMELSQRAIRNKRRIGIPAHTQTRMTVTRVRDQAIDVQTDLYSYMSINRCPYIYYRDVATETVPMTPRCKEIAVGPTGSLDFSDRSTETKRVVYKNSLMMTDIVIKSERCTQTQVIPPPRRKKRASNVSKHVCSNENRNFSEECSTAPVISINISQVYPVDSESQTSDDNSENLNTTNSKSSVVTTTPDLLTNHSTIDPQNIINIGKDELSILVNVSEDAKAPSLIQDIEAKPADPSRHSEEFPDTDDFNLPRVSPNSVRKANSADIKNMILGRSDNIYPYNITLSPSKERDSKRIVKFKDNYVDQAIAIASETSKEFEKNNRTTNKYQSTFYMTTPEEDFPEDNDYESLYSDTTESSKVDTDSFIWKNGNSPMGSLRKNYVPVYKSSKYKSTKARVFKDYQGMEYEGNEKGFRNYETRENIRDISSSDSRETVNASEYKRRRRKTHFEDKLHYNRDTDYNYDDMSQFQSIERKLLDSCSNLEESVNKYENYVTNNKEGMDIDGFEGTTRRPKEYLQHLVQLRREVVKAESGNTDSSIDVSHK